MDKHIIESIKNACKSDDDAKSVIDIFSKLENTSLQLQTYLSLLEQAIKGDYDSILITELDFEKPGPKIVYVNEGFTRMTGYSREEAIGKTPRILQGPKTDRATLDRLKDCLKNGKSFFGQAVNYKKDGTEFVNQWDIHPIHNPEGDITHWVSYQHDITSRKTAELTFLENDVEFDDLYEYSKRTLIDVGQDGKILMANKSFRELFGFTNDELNNMKIWDFLPSRMRENGKTELRNLWNHQSETKFRTFANQANGCMIQLEVEAKALHLPNESILRFNVKNLTLQKKVMKTLTKRNKQFDTLFANLK